MTVKELIKELKRMPQDAEVYTVNDWDAVDDNNCLTDLHEIIEINQQVEVIDMGLEFEDIHEVLLY